MVGDWRSVFMFMRAHAARCPWRPFHFELPQTKVHREPGKLAFEFCVNCGFREYFNGFLIGKSVFEHGTQALNKTKYSYESPFYV